MLRYMGENGLPMSDECRRILYETTPASLEVDVTESNKDVINDIGKYIHHILEDDDTETVKSKQAFNAALITSAEMQLAHREAANLLSVAKIEEIWDLTSESDYSHNNIDIDDNPIETIMGNLPEVVVDNPIDTVLDSLPEAIASMDIVEDPYKQKSDDLLHKFTDDIEVAEEAKEDEGLITVGSSEGQGPS